MARLTTSQAAQRLGVKPETIYAYVSRGLLDRSLSADGHKSTFSATDIERLARRGRPRQASRSHSLDFTISTAITEITQTHLRYRGYDATRLARTVTFEQVAELLLTGRLTEHEPWPVNPLTVPATSSVFDHVGTTALITGDADPFRADLDPSSVAQAARNLIAAVVDSRPVHGDGRTPRLIIGEDSYRSSIAGRLWTRLTPRRPLPGVVATLNAALVLLADHELAVSTVGVRVAASTRADPYRAIAAGTAVMSGPLHGAASRAARRMLDAAFAVGGRTTLAVERAAAQALEANGMYPGYGHKVYKQGDPRADLLLAMIREVAGGSREMAVVDGLIATIRKRRDVQPNIDMALAALGLVADLPEDSGEWIFSVARISGWAAHAIEEYAEAPLRFRARAQYAG
jgi:citrate synthase